MTQTLKASDVRSNWSQLLNQVFRGETEVIVEKSGIPVAAIVSAQDFKELQQIKLRRQKNFKLLDEIRSVFKDQTPDQIQTSVAQAITEIRQK